MVTLPHLYFDLDRAKLLIKRYTELRDSDPSGCSDALGDALEAVRPLVRLIAPRFTPEDEVEDVEQEILLHIAGVLPRYNRNERDLNAWLVKIIRNKSISLWRLRSNSVSMCELDDNVAGPDGPDEDGDIDAPVEHASGLLVAWLRVRFPSIPPRRTRKIAELLATYMLDNKPAKHTKAALVNELVDVLRINQIGLVYDSVQVFMRLLALNPAYVIDEMPLYEFSLMPELKLVLGDSQSRVLYTIFRGSVLRFRIKP